MGTAAGRPVPLGHSLNCRDLGGWATSTGDAVRSGVLFRSDLPVLAEEHGEHLGRLDLRTVIDLREPEERVARPASLANASARIVALPLGLGPLVAADPSKANSLQALYRTAVLETGPQIASVVSQLGQPGALPGLVHCAAGKDRTGVVVAILLSALGVSDDDVARDYARSGEYLTSTFFDDLDSTTHQADHVDLTALRAADADEILRVLSLVRQHAEDAETYLLRNGVPRATWRRLREALLTRSG